MKFSTIPTRSLFLLALLLSGHAGAAIYSVDTTDDFPDGDITDGICSWMADPDPNIPTCTLRAAVMQANAIPVNESPNVIIHLISGKHYMLTGSSTESDMVGAAGDLDIARPMTIGVASAFAPARITGLESTERIFSFLPGASGSIIRGVKLTSSSLTTSGCVAEAKDNAGAVTFERVEIFNTQCNVNGAIWGKNEQLTIRDSEFHHNERAIRVTFNVLTIENSTFHDNLHQSAIYTYGGTANVISSTFSNNRLAINSTQSNVLIVHSTFADNHWHIFFGSEGGVDLLNIRNSLFVDSTESSCAFEGQPGLVDVSGSIFDDESCLPNNNIPAVPNVHNALVSLTALGDFGGPTQTREPHPGSDGIDHIPPAACATNGVDQRGYPRAVSYYGEIPARCDAGSVELNPLAAEDFIFGDGFEDN